MRVEQLIKIGAISEEAADCLKQLVQSGYNIFVSGGTGAGKTTFLNALSEFIPPQERLITIEDSAELQIQSIPNLVRLETRTANMEGVREITIRDLIRTALRMRPDERMIKKGTISAKKAYLHPMCIPAQHPELYRFFEKTIAHQARAQSGKFHLRFVFHSFLFRAASSHPLLPFLFPGSQLPVPDLPFLFLI